MMPPVEERAVGDRQVVERHVDRLDDDLGSGGGSYHGVGGALLPRRTTTDGSSARAGLARAIRAKSRLAKRIVASARRTVPPSGEGSR